MAYKAASPASGLYGRFGDFTYYVLRIERVRWVGGYGRMDSTDPGAYHAAEPDPVAAGAAYAIEHLNDDHADALLLMAQALGGHPDATEATCVRIDRYGLDLRLQTRAASPRRGSRSPSRRTRPATCAARPWNSRAAPAPLLLNRTFFLRIGFGFSPFMRLGDGQRRLEALLLEQLVALVLSLTVTFLD